ncbi:MAG: hypothetical protein FWC01_05200 [Treponema sp.]|nr:hypothetical protein [Treponema sp.]MCL2237280.1 hypothetical protein [Treponema sp.]
MKTRNLALDIIVVIIFLSVALVSLDLFRRDLQRTFRLQNEEPVGTVVVKKNIVQRRLGDRVLWDRLAKESPVYYWDLIRVAELSDATLYINDYSISLHENTLIRIIPSPDGDGVMVVLSQGSLLLAASEESEGLVVDVNGRHIRPEPGTFLNTSISESGEASYQIIENAEQLAQAGIAFEMRSVQLVSPAINSVIRYSGNLPSVNFHWKETEDAVNYIMEISASPDFSNPNTRRQTSSVFLSDSTLENGLWYWRVKPVMSLIFTGSAEFSAPSFFRIERADAIAETNANETSISQWLAMETPSTQVPSEVPAQFVPGNFTVMEAPAVTQTVTQSANTMQPTPQPTPRPAATTQPTPRPAATAQPTPRPAATAQPTPRPAATVQPTPRPAATVQPTTPPPPELLPAAQNLRPANRTIFGYAELQSQRTIVFNWANVQGANAYIFTLYRQASDGMHEVVSATVTNTGYTLNDLQLLDKGNFFWKVEPVRTARGNAIERRGNTAESYFSIDFPAPLPVQIEETGILYGN